MLSIAHLFEMDLDFQNKFSQWQKAGAPARPTKPETKKPYVPNLNNLSGRHLDKAFAANPARVMAG